MSGTSSIIVYSMPVIGLPTSGSDPVVYYNAATGGNLQVEAAPNEGLKISLPDSADKKLYSMVKGFVTFIPAGNPLPTLGQEPSQGQGSVVLQTGGKELVDLKTALRSLTGSPPMAHVLYLNVKPDSVRIAIRPYVQALTIPKLEEAWNHLGSAVPAYSNKTELEDKFLDLVMQSKAKVDVDGGSLIGDASHKDPNDPSLGVEFTLRFLDTPGNDLSPILHIRNFPSYGGVEWEGHPLIKKVSDIPVPVDIYLKFEIWEKGTSNYVALPADIDVDIKDYDILSPDDLLGTRKTDSNGCVHFSSSDDPMDPTNPNKKGIPALLEAGHDLYFVVRTDGTKNHAGHTLPEEWSTMDWLSVPGASGYFKDFAGGQLGDLNKPLVFRVGLDYHFRFNYLDSNAGADRPSPKGVKVQFIKQMGGVSFHEDETDEKGEVHGISFDINAKDSIYLRIPFYIEDASINLPKASVQTSEIYWDTYKKDADCKEFIDIRVPHLGTYTHPDVFRATINERNVGFYLMKILRELSVFLYNLTDGDWKGIPNLSMFTTSISGYGYAWPVGHVNIPPNAHWKRDIIIHEISHQVMWKEADYSTLGILYEATYFGLIGDLYMEHGTTYYTNRRHALLEGWAEFIEGIFDGTSNPPYWVIASNLRDEDGDPLPSTVVLPPNWGERVEGAFANGLWTVFRKDVASLPPVSTNPIVPESPNGDITAASLAPWITNAAIKQKFLDIIWKPLKDLKTLSDPDTIAMLNNMKSHNPTAWPAILPDLQSFNLAMTPTISAISPVNGPSSGGQEVTITGTNFVKGIEVKIGGNSATDIKINSDTEITAKTPAGSAGAKNIVVTTLGESAIRTGGYTYI